MCAVSRISSRLVLDVTVTIHAKQGKKCCAHLKDFTLLFSLVPLIQPLLLAMQWKNKIKNWQYMAGSSEVRPALLAGSREGITARGSRRQSVQSFPIFDKTSHADVYVDVCAKSAVGDAFICLSISVSVQNLRHSALYILIYYHYKEVKVCVYHQKSLTKLPQAFHTSQVNARLPELLIHISTHLRFLLI